MFGRFIADFYNYFLSGPLITLGNVKMSEGDNAELPCFLRVPSRKPIIGGLWRKVSPSDVHLLALMRTGSSLKWNSTGVINDKVRFIDLDLHADFNVTLIKVITKNAYSISFNLKMLK